MHKFSGMKRVSIKRLWRLYDKIAVMDSSSQDNAVLERMNVPKGTMIVREGEKGNTAYLIQSGLVQITVSKKGKDVALAEMGPGQIFGEMALINETKRSATVKAVMDTNLIVITRQMIDDKLRKSDPTIRALLPMLMRRLEQTNKALLNKEDNLTNLLRAANTIYENIQMSLPPTKKKTLENQVKPKFDEFLMAVKAFEESHKKDES